MIQIYNANCIDPNKRIADESVDLGIFDPPFGIGEAAFDKHYNREDGLIIGGYQEAPKDYDVFTLKWMTEAVRVLKPNGSMYIIIGHSSLRHVLNAAYELGLAEVNHIIWKYNFGVATKKKFVTSHYHILYLANPEGGRTFNTNCRFGSQERDKYGGSLLYDDLEDVFVINKEFSPGETKNQNKLPSELLYKLIMYSSNPGDMVCDFFMGNFTTAYAALHLGRHVCGYEINQEAYDFHMPKLHEVEFGDVLRAMKPVENVVPANQGNTISDEEILNVCYDYARLETEGETAGNINEALQAKYGRGRFAIQKILDEHLERIRETLPPIFRKPTRKKGKSGRARTGLIGPNVFEEQS